MAVEGSIVDECQASERGEPCLEVDEDEPTQERNKCAGCRKIMEEHETKYYGHDDGVPSDQLEDMALLTSTDGLDEPGHEAPELLHKLHHGSSVLVLTVSPVLEYIFAGTEDGEIIVWSLRTFAQIHHIQAHKRSVLGLHLTQDGRYLFSSAGDPIVNVWCPRTMERLYEIYSMYDVGDIFSVAYCVKLDTVYIGAQDTSIQWVSLNDPKAVVAHDSERHPYRRYHPFFDSKAVGGTSTPRTIDEKLSLVPKAQTVLEMDSSNVLKYAQYGYVYCMLVAKGPTMLVDADEEVLITGGGEGTIKVWKLGEGTAGQERSDDYDPSKFIKELMCLGTDDFLSVMAIAVDGSFLYAGKLKGIVELWDLDTKQKLRVVKAHQGDVMALNMAWGCLWSASTTGSAAKHSTTHYGKYKSKPRSNVSQAYQCLTRWKAHKGKVIASAVTSFKGNNYFITGANDNDVCIWQIPDEAPEEPSSDDAEDEDVCISTLREFVSYKTISSRPEFAEDCHKGANFLGTLFKRMGGHVEMLTGGSDKAHNPTVLATFSGKLEPAEERKRILFYGHYDVVAADSKKGKWISDPFELHGRDGYLYGRGVTDNKGPIVAALFAVTDLMEAKALDNDIIFLIEGEEEFGSRTFQDTVQKNKAKIGHVDYILLANSYWLDDEVPCLTYGLRGVLHASACVDASHPDRHSGVDGSCLSNEPLWDLTSILSNLKNKNNRVMIPGFYDHILPATPEEDARFDEIATIMMRRRPQDGPLEKQKALLKARWREPNLTIHRYKVSGPDGSLVSSHASAKFSFRLVPGQEVDDVIESLAEFLEGEFAKLDSGNTFTLKIDNKAEPWLGDPTSEIYRTLEEVVMEAWKDIFDHKNGAVGNGTVTHGEGESSTNGDGAKAVNRAAVAVSRPKRPLYIREGGSIPAIRYLEKEFGAPAAHLPCGQASDSAHLDNERLRVLNLMKSREIFGLVFSRL